MVFNFWNLLDRGVANLTRPLFVDPELKYQYWYFFLSLSDWIVPYLEEIPFIAGRRLDLLVFWL